MRQCRITPKYLRALCKEMYIQLSPSPPLSSSLVFSLSSSLAFSSLFSLSHLFQPLSLLSPSPPLPLSSLFISYLIFTPELGNKSRIRNNNECNTCTLNATGAMYTRTHTHTHTHVYTYMYTHIHKHIQLQYTHTHHTNVYVTHQYMLNTVKGKSK